MTEPAVVVRKISKKYHLGVIDRKTMQDEVRYWWHRIRGRDPRRHMGRIDLAVPAFDDEDSALHPEGGAPQSFWALKDISFEVQPGEVVGVIGRNGAGKSTLLKVLCRITAPTSGEAVINGRVGSLLEVGTGFHPELTGRENVYMNGTILGMKKAEVDRKFDEIVSFAEIEQFLDTPVKRYSSGMYVRLAFAVAAHLDPEILVVDEVLAVGDMQFQKKCLGKMQDVSESGRTVLFVSHNMPAVSRLCTRAVLLDKGRMVYQGTADDVVNHYLSHALGASAVQRWTMSDAPGQHGFKLLEIDVVDAENRLTGKVETNQPFRIRLKYRVAEAGMEFRCMVILFTQGVCAFSSTEASEYKHAQPGIYEACVNIPANLLAEGEYLVGVSIFASRGSKLHFCKIMDAIAFQASDKIEGNSARGDYAEFMNGVTRPLLEWTKSYAGDIVTG